MRLSTRRSTATSETRPGCAHARFPCLWKIRRTVCTPLIPHFCQNVDTLERIDHAPVWRLGYSGRSIRGRISRPTRSESYRIPCSFRRITIAKQSPQNGQGNVRTRGGEVNHALTSVPLDGFVHAVNSSTCPLACSMRLG